MSYTALIALDFENVDNSKYLAKIRNGNATIMPLWREMTRLYGGEPSDSYDNAFWDHWVDPEIPLEVRAVFAMTFDRFYIMAKDFARAAEDIRKAIRLLPAIDSQGNWSEIRAVFEKLADNPQGIPAIGFHPQSCGEYLWEDQVSYDHEKGVDVTTPFDWDTTSDLYARLDDPEEYGD